MPNTPSPGWPRFQGPTHDCHSTETNLRKDLPAEGLPVLWQVEKGTGHPLPAISGERLVFIHLVDGQETIECLNAVTGEKLWKVAYPVQAGSSYGIRDAPRSSPVIDGNMVYVLGVRGDLHALKLDSGEIVWKQNLDAKYGEAPFFFGRGSCPLVHGEKLIVNIGSKPCVAALNKMTGELIWGTEHEWNASYASPMPAVFHGRERILVFAGGMSDPPNGGLLCLDPATGKIDDQVPWRSTGFASVNAASPVVIGNSVFITEGYDQGGALVQFSPEMKASIAWQAPQFACQFSTPVAHEGHLYGFSGMSEAGAEMLCYDLASGEEKWRESLEPEIESGGRKRRMLLGRASLLRVDGAFLCLGELGTLAWLDLSPAGPKLLSHTQLFMASETWGVPPIVDGRLYINQNDIDHGNGAKPRLICYNFRAA